MNRGEEKVRDEEARGRERDEKMDGERGISNIYASNALTL